MPAARETPIAITLRSQFAFRISGTPVVPRRNSRDRQNSALSTAARIKRMLNEFIAQNRVSVVRNGVQSSTHISARSYVLSRSLPPIFSLFLFLDTLVLSTRPTLSLFVLFISVRPPNSPVYSHINIYTLKEYTRIRCVCASL